MLLLLQFSNRSITALIVLAKGGFKNNYAVNFYWEDRLLMSLTEAMSMHGNQIHVTLTTTFQLYGDNAEF